jgi:hypothetical protein
VTQLGFLLANNYPKDIAQALIDNGGVSDDFVSSCPAVGYFISGAQSWLATSWRNEGGAQKAKKTEEEQVKAIGGEEKSHSKKRRGAPMELGRESMPRKMLKESNESGKASHCSMGGAMLDTVQEEGANESSALKRDRDEEI